MNETGGHRARKRFGQNFLRDQGVIQRILRSIAARTDDHIVEIGPGQGALTQGLFDSGCELDVIELDRDLVPLLQAQFAHSPRFHLHQGDALAFDFSSLARAGEPLRIVGNLPYNISTPLLFHLLDYADTIKDMHFMLQKEVVDRMAAEPGSKAYGRLSVMLQISCEVTPLFRVAPESFSPPPKVDSGIVRLTPLKQPRVSKSDRAAFGHLISAAFAQRRKTLRNNLKGILDSESIAALDIDPGIRTEQLTIEELITLFRASQTQGN